MKGSVCYTIIFVLLLLLIWSVWAWECPLIEENRERLHDGLYRRGIYPYSVLPPYRQVWYHRLYAPWYDPLYTYDEPYGYCRRFGSCYPCPGWRNMGPPMCP